MRDNIRTNVVLDSKLKPSDHTTSRLKHGLALVTVVGCTVLTGCSGPQKTLNQKTVNPKSLISNPLSGLFGKKTPKPSTLEPNQSTLPSVDLNKKPGIKDQYFVDKFSVGAWVNQAPGTLFQPMTARDPKAAIVYFYRPHSTWNRQEAVAPNFFLNGKRIPSLINNQYYWLELPEGKYRLTFSRPLGVLHFQKPKPVDFSVQAGQDYYLKYEEQTFRGAPDSELGLLRVGPIMQMPLKQGLAEIRATELKTPGISFVKYKAEATQAKNTVFVDNIHGNKYQKVSKNQLTQKTQPVLGVPFKIWNPLTW